MRGLIFSLLFFFSITGSAQSVCFAEISDTHIGSSTGAEDLRNTVKSVNNDDSLQFVILSGDITEFGSDDELNLAKQILDSLQKPWYIIPGNHDANWSESGSNSFRKIFAAEHFSMEAGGFLFAGTASGPNMRMSPGQVPREDIVWLDSLLSAPANADKPLIFINHYPIDEGLNNWYKVLEILYKHDTRLVMCGHGHRNKRFEVAGIPSVMCRSNLRAKDEEGGYNKVTITKDSAKFVTVRPVSGKLNPWCSVSIQPTAKSPENIPTPSFAVNDSFPGLHTDWIFQDNADIGAGIATDEKTAYVADTNGDIIALDGSTGKPKWKFHSAGKIYSTPALGDNLLVAGSTDGNIYALDKFTGKQKWKLFTGAPIVGSPLIQNGRVFIGASDGQFRCLNLKTGVLQWTFDSVKNFVSGKPLLYEGYIYFGSWGTEFYALDAATGHLKWKWNNPVPNRMFSAAACVPVAADGKIFIVAPDRYMTAFEAKTGNIVWRTKNELRVRESMGGIVEDSTVYAKTMDGEIIAIDTRADTQQIRWKADAGLGYELAPTALALKKQVLFIPSDKGVVLAMDRTNGRILWKYKITHALVTGLTPLPGNRLLVSCMDGKVECLNYSAYAR